MALRLNGSSSGYVELDVPAAAGSHTLTLPNSGGSSGQYLQTNGAGALSWQTVTPALFESYAIIADRKTNGTSGGGITANTVTTRTLNTELYDPDGIVSISSNQFTLGAGNYYIHFSTPAYRVQEFTAYCYDVTNSTTAFAGQAAYSYSGDGDISHCQGYGRVAITANTVYEIRIIVDTANSSPEALGRASTASNYTGNEIYTVVEIFKEA